MTPLRSKDYPNIREFIEVLKREEYLKLIPPSGRYDYFNGCKFINDSENDVWVMMVEDE